MNSREVLILRTMDVQREKIRAGLERRDLLKSGLLSACHRDVAADMRFEHARSAGHCAESLQLRNQRMPSSALSRTDQFQVRSRIRFRGFRP